MYALIFLEKNEKKVISIHASRKDAERGLKKRQEALGKDAWECQTRIIWTDQAVQPGDVITAKERCVVVPTRQEPS